ncbi:MAG: Crp/Fnr family transcriptional regulator [Candidatus Eisenbacteria bacterium]
MPAALARYPMFSGLERGDLALLASVAVRQRFEKGETIFIEGNESLGFYVVERGRVKVYKVSPEGKEHILHIIEAGFSFAEACIFFEEHKCPASAEALEDTVTIFFPRVRFLDVLRRSSSIAMRMLGSMAGWVRLMAEEVGGLSLSTVEGRLVHYLFVLSRRTKVHFKDETVLRLDVPKRVLASRLGTIPETFSRTLRKLQTKGLLKVERSTIKILNASGLLDMLE